MTTTTLNTAQAASAPASNVGSAVKELATAAQKLVAALWAAATQSSVVAPRKLTAFEEAEQLRAYAASLPKYERDFAHDLFAAADRHEWANQ
ncbi:hypothetical protein [Rhodoferax aquaticus]|uniref:Uncharacterized protein n=1 Tax=Rhodoferax aquaticus TaxID=2527691 RepID=A0A515ER62_9BURK|nr:hypothetical protein [Rhodoferax aquaticus]QDL55161.1 hypothetical protein EXZ61_13850 [Rhodoferax aquaticus]